jgi:hypothetical protein
MRGRWWYWRRRLRRRARSGNEGLRTGRLASLGGVGVLQQGADLGEGGAWAHHGNEGRLLVEVIAETGDEDVDELPIGHGIAEFTKLVGDSTKVLAVGADRGVALDGVAELVVEAGDAAVDVVLEELPKSRPKGGSSGGAAKDEIEDLGGDAGVDPLDDGEIVFDPLRIIGTRRNGAVDMPAKIAAS